MKRVRFSSRARSRLVEIAIWTGESFGIAQAERYEADLLSGITALGRGERFGRSCAALAPGQPEAVRLKYIRLGQHYVIYDETATEVEIIDVLHGARDLPALLDGLDAANDPD